MINLIYLLTKQMKVLVTGAAGFIGYYLVGKLLQDGHDVVGMDNINDYYDPGLKYARLLECGIEGTQPFLFGKEYISSIWESYRFVRINLEDRDRMLLLFREEGFEQVIHLAAQAGVRYSLENPWAYVESNIVGTMSILEACRQYPVKQLIYATSSSVYGNSPDVPYSTEQCVDYPISLYAATKKSNELMAYTYSHLYHIPTVGLRFFTVYGPWGRPDMAYYSFTTKILAGDKIDVFNNGELWRDFTYINDIISGLHRIIESPADIQQGLIDSNFALYNIGNSSPVKLLDFINTLENILGKKAKLNLIGMQPGDVLATHADIGPLESDFGFRPDTCLQEGLEKFIGWYRSYYGV